MTQQTALSYRQLQCFLAEYKEYGLTEVKLNSSKEVLQVEYDRLVQEAKEREAQIATMSSLSTDDLELYSAVVNYVLYESGEVFDYILGFASRWVHNYILWDIRYINPEGEIETNSISDVYLRYVIGQVSEVCDPEMHIQEAIANLRKEVPVSVVSQEGKYTISFQWTGITCYGVGNKIVIESYHRLEDYQIIDTDYVFHIYCGKDKFKEFSNKLTNIFYIYQGWEE